MDSLTFSKNQCHNGCAFFGKNSFVFITQITVNKNHGTNGAAAVYGYNVALILESSNFTETTSSCLAVFYFFLFFFACLIL